VCSSDLNSADTAVTITKSQTLKFDNPVFAAAVITSGRSISSISVETGEPDGAAVAIGAVLKLENGKYEISGAALTAGKTYKLTILTSNFAEADLKSLNSVVYYIKVVE
jgi:hypothetical protein